MKIGTNQPGSLRNQTTQSLNTTGVIYLYFDAYSMNHNQTGIICISLDT